MGDSASFTAQGQLGERLGLRKGAKQVGQSQDRDLEIQKPLLPRDPAPAHGTQVLPACWFPGESSGDGTSTSVRPPDQLLLTSSPLTHHLPHGSPDTPCKSHPWLFFLTPPWMSSYHPVQAGPHFMSKTAADIYGAFTCARHTLYFTTLKKVLIIPI